MNALAVINTITNNQQGKTLSKFLLTSCLNSYSARAAQLAASEC